MLLTLSGGFVFLYSLFFFFFFFWNPQMLLLTVWSYRKFMVVLSLQVLQFRPSRQFTLPRASTGNVIRCGIAEPSGEPAPLGQKTRYNDGVFEKVFMTLFARKMEKFAAASGKAGAVSKKKGWLEYDYESFVDVSKRVMQGRSRMQQQHVVREVLLSMLPPGAPAQVDNES